MYMGKVDFNKGYWNPKRNLGVTTHFQIKLTFNLGEKYNTLFCVLAFFRIIVA